MEMNAGAGAGAEQREGCGMRRQQYGEKMIRAIVFLPLAETSIMILSSVFSCCDFIRDFKMKHQFTPTSLCDVNGVKSSVKRQKPSYDFTPTLSLCL
jgi:hypothetical protein